MISNSTVRVTSSTFENDRSECVVQIRENTSTRTKQFDRFLVYFVINFTILFHNIRNTIKIVIATKEEKKKGPHIEQNVDLYLYESDRKIKK